MDSVLLIPDMLINCRREQVFAICKAWRGVVKDGTTEFEKQKQKIKIEKAKFFN